MYVVCQCSAVVTVMLLLCMLLLYFSHLYTAVEYIVFHCVLLEIHQCVVYPYILLYFSASGGELYRHMECREEGFSEVQVRHVLRHTLEGLAFLHQRNIVHMDIKVQA